MNSVLRPMADHLAEPHDRRMFKRSVWLRARYVVLRGLGVLAVVYVTSAIFNLVELVLKDDRGFLNHPSEISAALLLDEVPLIYSQAIVVVPTIVGILLLSLFLVATSQPYQLAKRWLAHRITANESLGRRYRHSEFRTLKFIGLTSTIEAAIIKLFYTVPDDPGAFVRMQHLIEKWLSQDRTLAAQTAYLMRKKSFTSSILAAVATSAGAVILTRLLLLLHP
jgi:hypothetical protein